MVGAFEKAVRARFSDAAIREMTLADIGAYDGHFAVEIERRLPFKKISAIEPRQRNIDKGKAIRSYLGIQTACEFQLGDIDSTEEQFDIVFCAGVMHHVSDIDAAIRGLRRIAKRAAFIECQCYPEPPANRLLRWLYDRFNLRAIEPKDIVYNFLPKSYAISGHKFESGYYHGSTTGAFSLVTLPSPQALCMSLKAHAFDAIEIVSSPADYRRHISSRIRTFHAVCVFALTGETPDFRAGMDEAALAYETAMLKTLIPSPVLDKLEKRRGLVAYVAVRDFKPAWLARLILRSQILGNIKYRPDDKIALERSKALIAEGRDGDAILKLRLLTDTPNTDWRVMYRSCCLLSGLYRSAGQPKQADYFRGLCLRANPNFPAELLG